MFLPKTLLQSVIASSAPPTDDEIKRQRGRETEPDIETQRDTYAERLRLARWEWREIKIKTSESFDIVNL